MFATDDSIVAIATPPGRGGIGVVRISGPGARNIGQAILQLRRPLTPRLATFTRARLRGGDCAADEVIATLFAEPHSYTGQDVLEISAHGSPVVLQGIVRGAIDAGARLAEPGEFTLRAFLNGKRDLVRAEAVADLVDAATPLQARVAFDQLQGTLTRRIADLDATLFDLIARLEASLDFPDEGYHFVAPAETARGIGAVVAAIDRVLADADQGRMIREGATVVIAGRPNVGKSSIFNKLAGSERAIVTAVAGTTRDLVTERVDIEGLAVTLVDTAGWRETLDEVEREGVARSERARAIASLTLVIVDQSAPLTAEDEQLLEATAGMRRLVVGNKSDLMGRVSEARRAREGGSPPDVSVSAKTGEGLARLRSAIACRLTGSESLRDTASVSNVRHIALLQQARASLTAGCAASAGGAPEEFVLADLQAARARLDEVVGTRTSDDVLRHIFERFCIGK
ncbi:MAG TPA: tRNA uridine-5-carboxymethylaminomethyl(34) synthesis GTPase MnmE [Vicinamibacterales bacterium]